MVQASLKYRRALTKVNPTPMDEDTGYEHLCEEIADVLLYLKQLPYNRQFVREIMDSKEKRWKLRMEINSFDNAKAGKG